LNTSTWAILILDVYIDEMLSFDYLTSALFPNLTGLLTV
jgi:hypothetical protein